jgi:hypothetical protein
LHECYGKLLANGHVDERFIKLMTVQSALRILVNK